MKDGEFGIRAVSAVLVFLLVGASTAYFGWWIATPGDEIAVRPLTSSHAFLLPSLDGENLGPAAYVGDVVVVDYWTTWCGPCHAQARILEMLHQELGEKVHFFAVDVAEEDQTVRDYVEDRPFPYPVLLDRDGAVAEKARVYGFPTVMIYGRAGEVIFQRVGITSKRALRSVILEELGLEAAVEASS